jgi:hypothetical protein
LPDSEERRLTLPVYWGESSPPRLILTRRFGRPTGGKARQALFLRLEQVEGLCALEFNGRPIVLGSAVESRHEVELGELLERNVLVLEVQTSGLHAGPGQARREWGKIALVVRSNDRGDSGRGPT